MKATLLVRERIAYSDDFFTEIVVWQLPAPIAGSHHLYKYRLVCVVSDQCVLRYDNESGKGDHRHFRGKVYGYEFRSIRRLLHDFQTEVRSLSDENRGT